MRMRSVGMIFMPNNDQLEAQCKEIVAEVCKKEGVTLVAWRKVPVDQTVVGRFAKVTEPRIWQLVVEGKQGQLGDELERELFVLRKLIEKEKNAKLPAEFAPDFYVCTLSNRTITYKVGRKGGRVPTGRGVTWHAAVNGWRIKWQWHVKPLLS